MADFPNEFFDLGMDDEYDGGSFDGFDDFGDGEAGVSVAGEIDGIEPQVDAEDKAKDGKAPDKKEPAKATPGALDTNQLVALMAKQQEQINTLTAVNQKLAEPKAPVKEPGPLVKPEFSAAEWEDNPEACTDALYKYNRTIEKQQEQAQAHEQQEQTRQQTTQLQQAHNTGWNTVLKVMPELNTNEPTELRNIYAKHFAAVKGDPLGTLKAMNAMEKDPRAQAILKEARADVQAKEPVTNAEPTAAEVAAAKAKGAADEKARSSRVKAGVMHGSGKGGGQQKVSITPDQHRAAQQFGVSDEAYMESFKAMGGKA